MKNHGALETIMPGDLFVTVHITVNERIAKHINATLDGLPAGCKKHLRQHHGYVIEKRNGCPDTESRRSAPYLGFDLPVPYSAQNPVAFETEQDDLPSGVGKAWLYVEPDGDVLPSQGMAGQVMGNMLRDEWEKIYHS